MAKRSWVRRVLGAGAIAGAAYAVWRAIEANRPEGDTDWEPQPFPFPPQPRATALADSAPAGSAAPPAEAAPAPKAASQRSTSAEPSLESTDGSCPSSHPVKVARGSKVFHVPDGQMYDRTSADRCYRDPAAAEADGLRQSKR